MGEACPRPTARLPVIVPSYCVPAKAIFDDPVNDSGSPLTTTIPYSKNFNPKQRHAVEHGGSALAEAGPLLIIAGAGSGKTNTLAHRVAHLIVNGIVANVMRGRAAAVTDAIV
jgi:hypothetical protein